MAVKDPKTELPPFTPVVLPVEVPVPPAPTVTVIEVPGVIG
jgi:hypothetical protein